MAISGCLGFPGLWAGSRGDTFCGHLLFQPAATSASAAMRHSGVSFCCPYLYIERKRDPWVCSEMGVFEMRHIYIYMIYIIYMYMYMYIYMLKFYVNAVTTLTNQLISGKHASGRSLGTLVPFGKQTRVVNHPSPLSGYGSKVDTTRSESKQTI